MEKILLINPPQTYYIKTYRESAQGSIGLPLGLLYIATALEQKGCHVKIVDSLVPEHTIVRKNKDHVFVGMPQKKLVRIIEEYKPNIVGLTNQFTTQEEYFLKTAELVKNVDNHILLIVGGANVSCRARHLLTNSNIDIAIKSEGETAISEIIDFYRGETELRLINGIAYRNGSQILETEANSYIDNLDTVGFPAYHLVDMEKYLTLYKKLIYTRDRDVKRNISMITSRGCPYKCIFCSISKSMGKRWRPHSTGFIISHIEHLSETYQVKHIHFEDDNLLFKPKRFLPILDVLARKKITWDTPNGIRVDLSIDEKMLNKMYNSGCKSLTIGVESGDQQVLNKIVRKEIKLEDVEEFARRCKKVNLPLRAFFILGFPGETIQTMQKTIDFGIHLLKTYSVEIINLIATPLYGTKLYNICNEKNYIKKEITPRMLSESTVSDGNCLINTESFSSKDVERMSKLFTAKVYRKLILKGISNPIESIRRVGNIYVLKRTLKRMFT